MTGKLEECARAICVKQGDDPDQVIGTQPIPEQGGSPSNVETIHRGWQLYLPHARAVLEALREPDEGALDVGIAFFPGGEIEPELHHVRDVVQAVIDSILTESETTP